MRINWKNIYGMLGVILCVYLFFKTRPIAAGWFESMQYNREFFEEHPELPFLTIAVVCATIVGIIKMLSRRNK